MLLVAYHFTPMNSAGVQRPLQMSKLLPRYGVDVFVLTHTFARTDLRSVERVLRVYDTSRSGLHALLHIPLRILQRIVRKLGGATSWHGIWASGVKRRARKIFEMVQPDLVFSTYPPIETLDIGLYLSRKFDVPLVADFRDGLLFEPVEPEMLRSNNTRARYAEIESEVANRATTIITVSEPISDYFRTHYRHRSVLTIPNGFDPNDVCIMPGPTEIDRSKFNVVYTGRLSGSEKGRTGTPFIAAIRQIVRDSPELADKLRVHLLGEFSAAEKSEWEDLIQRGTVRLHGLVERPRALGFQRAATLLLLIATESKSSVATSKLFEYLNAQRPILGLTRGTAAEQIILATQAGLVVDPSDSAAVCLMLRRLMTEPDLLDSIKPRPSEVERYSRPHQMQELAAYLKRHVSPRVAVRQPVSAT